MGMILVAVLWIQLSHKALSAVGSRLSARVRPTADSREPTAPSYQRTEAP
jgi:hypothetical protein